MSDRNIFDRFVPPLPRQRPIRPKCRTCRIHDAKDGCLDCAQCDRKLATALKNGLRAKTLKMKKRLEALQYREMTDSEAIDEFERMRALLERYEAQYRATREQRAEDYLGESSEEPGPIRRGRGAPQRGGATSRPRGTRAPPSSGPTAAPPSSGPTAAPPSSGPTAAPPSSGPTGAPPSSGLTAAPPSSGPIAAPPSSGITGSPPPPPPRPRTPYERLPRSPTLAEVENRIEEVDLSDQDDDDFEVEDDDIEVDDPPTAPTLPQTTSFLRLAQSQPPEAFFCSICQNSEESDDPGNLPCGHTFHTECFNVYLTHGGDHCPHCRRSAEGFQPWAIARP